MSTKILGQDIQTQKYTTAGGTTAYTATVPNLTALYDGFAITVKMNATNTGSSTLNVNWLGAKTIKKPGVTNLAASDLLIDSVYTFVYDLSQDFFFLSRVVSTTTNIVAWGWLPDDTFWLLDYIFAQQRTSGAWAWFDNSYWFVETATDLYAASFVATVDSNPDDWAGLLSILKINKTTFVATLYRSNYIGVSYSGATPYAYMTENGWIIYAGFNTWGTLDRYLSFDTATDTFGSYGSTTGTSNDVVLIWVAVPPTIYVPWTSGIAPWSALPTSYIAWLYSYRFDQRLNQEFWSDVMSWAAITFLLRAESAWTYDNISVATWYSLSTGLAFSSGGTWLSINEVYSMNRRTYTLSPWYDLSTLTYVSWTAIIQKNGLYVRQGTWALYSVLGDTTDRVYWNNNVLISAQLTDITAVWFRDNGAKMYCLDKGTGLGTGAVYQYSLATPWALWGWSVSYDSISLSVLPEDNAPTSMAMNSTGTELYIGGNEHRKVYIYTLSTPWDLSTAVYSGLSTPFWVDWDPLITGMTIKDDDSKIYIMGSDNKIYQYST